MRKPEILAPAGTHEALLAALHAGADAVYFGLDEGFNARARATNFSLEGLADTVALCHRSGARAYLALNTLVFQAELPVVAGFLARAHAAGIDAIIVQDPAVALLAQRVAPGLEVHASTQMTVSSPEGARFAEGLGVTRFVVPRELSVDEIRRLAASTPLELEVFVHGALCVSWSGQCLTSEAWGGRSANRGQCAQSCRLPYDLVLDGEVRELGDTQYLLSPRDLAGWQHIQDLCDAGVHGLKIEGRQKAPDYVATAVQGYRGWLDAIVAGDGEPGAEAEATLRHDLGRMALSYSRGFSAGFLGGADHQTLVAGRAPRHRGVQLGEVLDVRGNRVLVRTVDPDPSLESRSVRAGDGVVFDRGRPEEPEQGGPVFFVEDAGEGELWLGFGDPGPDLARVRPGERVWVTGDPSIRREIERLVKTPPPPKRARLEVAVSGRAGVALSVTARGVTVHSEALLAASAGAGLGSELLREKLGALGDSVYELGALDVSALEPGLHLPVSQLKAVRRALVTALDAQPQGSARSTGVEPATAVAELLAAGRTRTSTLPAAATTTPQLLPLCRTDEQLEAVIEQGLPEVELDWMELVGLGRAVARAREAGLAVTIATVRVQKPGEDGYDQRIARLAPDAVLVRHWGALVGFSARGATPRPAVHGDFSLNVTNAITAHHLLGLGLDTFTAAHDLDERQLFALLAEVPPERLTVTVHHHIATFHTEHCVYAHLLSEGRDYRTCGRPCEEHALGLRDPKGQVHPVVVDVGCRNTVFNARAQSAASLVPRLLASGVVRYRVEFVRESRAEASTVLAAYRALLDGRARPAEVVRRVGVHEQFGVTAGTMLALV